MQTHKDARAEMDTIPLDVYLPDMGEKLGVHITAHYLLDPTSFEPSAFEQTETPMDRSVNTIEELIQEIKRSIKGVQVVLDEHDKNNTVIHLIDEKLGEHKSILDHKIDLQWSGSPSDLVEELERRGVPGIRSPLIQDLKKGLTGDYQTEMKVNAQRQSLRHIFTHNLDLKSYSRLVWVAKTQQEPVAGAWRTWVGFTGPKMQRN